MGNHPSKERARSPGRGQGTHIATVPTGHLPPQHAHTAPPQPLSSSDRQGERPSANRRRSSRHDLNIFNIGNRQDLDPTNPEARRETRPEREARKLEKERALRAQERERSTREEHVDGGYLVTLGTYTGTEDFSKPTVRRLMVRHVLDGWRSHLTL
jgi:hypothetical protein